MNGKTSTYTSLLLITVFAMHLIYTRLFMTLFMGDGHSLIVKLTKIQVE